MHCWRTTPALITYKERRLSHSHLLCYCGLRVFQIQSSHRTADRTYQQSRWYSTGGQPTSRALKRRLRRGKGGTQWSHLRATACEDEPWTAEGKWPIATPKKGASSWLTILLLKLENYNRNKREFYDSISLRYRWTPKYLSSVWPGGKRLDVDYAMSCMKGGLSIGSMTKCKIRSHRCSRMYVMMSSRTTRADPKRRKSK